MADVIAHRLRDFGSFEEVYAPALQHGHVHHDLVNMAARRVFPNLIEYCTYSHTKPFYANEGARRIEGNQEEWELKRRAMKCYPSQVWSAGHFAAVEMQPEWLTP